MKYYTCSNTSSGFVDFTEDNIFDIKNKVMLKGENDCIKSYVLKLLREKTGECEEILCAGSRRLTNGLILREKSTAIVSKCNNSDRIIDLDEYFGVADYKPEIKLLYERMFNIYSEAKDIHDEWEKIYVENMDFSRLDNYCDGIIGKIVTTKSQCGYGKVYKRFFGTSTIEGPANHIDNITENIKKRYFIKGRPGTGKSTFLKKLSAKLRENDFDVEEYYCSFDKNSLDMVISRELSICVFDSTPPHEKFPQCESDEVLNFYVESGLSGIDEKFERKLYLVKSAYDSKIKEGIHFFKKAWQMKEESDRRLLTKISESDIRKIAKNIL